MNEIIKFQRVSLTYQNGFEVFRDLSFSLQTSSFHFLTGPSGAGKSSLLKLIYGGYRDYRGAINVLNTDLVNIRNNRLADFRRQIGVVFQNFCLFDHLSVLDNVAVAQRIHGVSWKKSRSRAAELLKWIGLGQHLNVFPETLSGGQKQRAVIARAVINRPKILLADEPTGNVDDETAVRLMYLFEELYKIGTTIIIATHNRDLATIFPHPQLHLENGVMGMYPAANEQKVA